MISKEYENKVLRNGVSCVLQKDNEKNIKKGTRNEPGLDTKEPLTSTSSSKFIVEEYQFVHIFSPYLQACQNAYINPVGLTL